MHAASNTFLKIVVLLVGIVVAMVSPLRAQTAPILPPDSLHASDQPQYELNPIVVTATRDARALEHVPYALDRLERKTIQRAAAGLSLDEALRAIPGVMVSNRFNLSQGDRLSIRGLGSRAAFGVRGIKIILDGVPLTLPDGQSQLNNLDLTSTGNIEILRGPSSSLYGNAAGGLINIQTEQASNLPLFVQPQVLTGAAGMRKWQTKISGQIGRQTLFINVNRLRLDGFREHAAARSTAVNAIGRHALASHLILTTVFNYFEAPYLLNPSSLSKSEAALAPTNTRFFIKQQGAGKQTRQGQSGVTLQYTDTTRHFEATIYGLSRSLLNPIPGRIIDLARQSGGLRASFSQRGLFGSSHWRWTLGVDDELQRDARVEFDNLGLPANQVTIATGNQIFSKLQYGPRRVDQQEKVQGVGPFAQLELAPNSQWTFTLGTRYDHYNFTVTDHFLTDGMDDSGTRRMQKVSPLFGVTYHPDDALTIYGNYAMAFQTPTTTELSNRPTGEGGMNPVLQPERLANFELGFRGHWPTWHLKYAVALYRLTITDLLIPYQLPEQNGEEVFFRNAGQARNHGLEAQVEWTPSAGLRVAASYTFMNFQFKDFRVPVAAQLVQLAGNKVPGVPAHHAFVRLTYEHSSGIYGEVNWQWSDRYFVNDFNGPSPGSAKPLTDYINEASAQVDLRCGYQHQFGKIGIDFFVGINNLLQARYNSSVVPNAAADRFFEPAPGRHWYAGASLPVSP